MFFNIWDEVYHGIHIDFVFRLVSTSASLQRQNLKSDSGKRKKRKSQKKRRRERWYRGGGNSSGGGGLPRKPRVVQIRTPSVASSPGRGTPSPDSLARICLYWEKRLNSPEYVIPTSSSEESE